MRTLTNSVTTTLIWAALIALWSILGAAPVAADHTFAGIPAADFPPGAFNDGGHYKLADFQGKLLVLFFYEDSCPNCAGRMPAMDAIFQQYKDKPVKFIGVGPHDSLADVTGYAAAHKLHVPIFADPLGIMSAAYNRHPISLENVIQFHVIGPDGREAGFLGIPLPKPEEIDRALVPVKWKYKDCGYEQRLAGAIDLLEWNQYEAGVKALRPLLKDSNKTVAASAQKLYDAVKAEGQAWKDKADKNLDSDPASAYDLYTQVAAVFSGDDLAKSVDEPLKKLKSTKAMTDELAARQMYGQLYQVLAKVNAGDKNAAAQVAKFCADLAAKYPGTPTAAKAQQIGQRAGSASAGH